MERSITKTLAAALALQAAAFAALAVLAAVGALLDAGPGSDLKTLDSIAREVRFMESRAAIAELEQGSARGESARADIVQADARLREQLAREDFPAGRLVYSRDLRSGMAGLARGLEDGYQRLVQQTMGSSWTAGPVMDFITGSQEAGSRRGARHRSWRHRLLHGPGRPFRDRISRAGFSRAFQA
jgi:hypothetical protein